MYCVGWGGYHQYPVYTVLYWLCTMLDEEDINSILYVPRYCTDYLLLVCRMRRISTVSFMYRGTVLTIYYVGWGGYRQYPLCTAVLYWLSTMQDEEDINSILYVLHWLSTMQDEEDNISTLYIQYFTDYVLFRTRYCNDYLLCRMRRISIVLCMYRTLLAMHYAWWGGYQQYPVCTILYWLCTV